MFDIYNKFEDVSNGDIVVLKSSGGNGRCMVVEPKPGHVGEDIHVVWADINGDIHRNSFHYTSVYKLIEENENVKQK